MNSDTILIKGGRVVDPANNIDKVLSVIIKDGKIDKFLSPTEDVKINQMIDATGQIVCPGLIDMHVHFREPGQEYKETIETGLKAAAKGGFTGVLCMPNTEPAIDNEGTVHYVASQARRFPYSNLWIAAAVTKGRKGEQMTEMGILKEAGVKALTDDGAPIATAGILKKVLQYSSMFDLLIIDHAEDLSLSHGGVMNEGYHSVIHGLKGIPEMAEDVIVARDILVSERTGVPIHIAHVSSGGAVDLIEAAQKKGVKVTAETAPHYTILCDEDVDFDTHKKMNPPLRYRKSVERIIKGLKDNVITIIATDHAPHQIMDKHVEFDCAPFGIIGLESSLAVILKSLYHTGILDLKAVIEKMSLNPARLLRLDRGTLGVGTVADITIFDLYKEWKMKDTDLESKSKNCPFLGWDFKGKVTHTLVGGKIVLKNGEICPV